MVSASEIERQIVRWLSDTLAISVERIDPEETFFAYGVDSLALVSLGVKLDALVGKEITVDTIAEFSTPRDLARHLAEHD